MEYLAFGHWVAVAIVATFVFAWKDWDVNVKNLNLGSGSVRRFVLVMGIWTLVKTALGSLKS